MKKKYRSNVSLSRFETVSNGVGKILALLSRGSDVKRDEDAQVDIMRKLYPLTLLKNK